MILVIGLLLTACGGGGAEDNSGEGSSGSDIQSQTWRFVTEETAGQVQVVYAEEFAKRISEKSGGNITVDVYEYGGLGSSTDQVELLQNGGVEMAVMSPSFTGGMVREGQLFALHFLFPDDLEKTHEVLKTSEALNTDLVRQYEEHSITPLAFWTEGFFQWTSNDVALDDPSDFNNFKVRVMPDPLIVESYEAYGAEPTPMDSADLYTALERGTVQGQENPIFFIEDMSFHEVQEYLTLSNHATYVAMTTVNTDWFNGLPQDVQDMVTETVEEMEDWSFEQQQQLNQAAQEEMQSVEGTAIEIIELSEEQRQAFREQAMPLRDYYRENVSTVNGEILDKLESEIEEIANQ